MNRNGLNFLLSIKNYRITGYLLFMLFFGMVSNGFSQTLTSIEFDQSDGLKVKSFNGFQQPGYEMPLVSFELNGILVNSSQGKKTGHSTTIDEKIVVGYKPVPYQVGLKAEITFRNISADTLSLANVVPFGASPNHVYITGHGKNALSRSHLFRPGYEPVNVLLPDNAWELGFSVLNVDNGNSISALIRRDKSSAQNMLSRRFENIIYPGGEITYYLWLEDYIGTWQEGLRRVFQERMLYDVEPGTFDNSIFERDDLKWIRKAWVGHFVSSWHNYFFNRQNNRYVFEEFQERMNKFYGGDDYVILWHGFPMLGIDQRNQWDMFRSQPGGITALNSLFGELSKAGTPVFTAYKPWDLPAASEQLFNSTRREDHFEGLAKITRESGLLGVMYDTRSESNVAMQQAMDEVTDGFVIFPEGMSVPKNMQKCMVGRVHGALTYPPFLNLNKLIKPEFSIFRQIILDNKLVKRDVAISYFNGYGVEIHLRVPVETDWMDDFYSYLGQTKRILEDNVENFISGKLSPLIPTTTDSVWVNQWSHQDKDVYTIYSTKSSGFNQLLFEVSPEQGYHFVDLWNHREIKPERVGGKYLVGTDIASFNPKLLGTSGEGSVGCIVRFSELMQIQPEKKETEWNIETRAKGVLKIWNGKPAYDKQPLVMEANGTVSFSQKQLGNEDGDIIIQLFDGDNLLDERIIPGKHQEEIESTEILELKDKVQAFNTEILEAAINIEKDSISVFSEAGDKIRIVPLDNSNLDVMEVSSGNQRVKLYPVWGAYEGDILVELLENEKVISSGKMNIPYGSPRLISQVAKTEPATTVPPGMVEIPAGEFEVTFEQVNWDINYPEQNKGKTLQMPGYFMDKHPVTNQQYKKFLDATGYQPADAENFLKHWENGKIPAGQENFPVVHVSIEDAQAYTKWAGKRLPTELEWQYAAQTSEGRLYPWGSEADSTGVKCNPGNGIPHAVGSFPEGENPLGLQDLTGCVWQLTNDVYANSLMTFVMLKGGSYFAPKASWWYVKSGQLPLMHRQQLYQVSAGYERAATIGFRCVKDSFY